MNEIQLNTAIQIPIDTLVEGLATLPTDDLEHIADKLQSLIAKRKQTDSADTLVRLIQTDGPSDAFYTRYYDLSNQVSEESISPEEYEELTKMIPIAENWTAQRLEYLIQLSQLWNVPVREVMKKLDIRPSNPSDA